MLFHYIKRDPDQHGVDVRATNRGRGSTGRAWIAHYFAGLSVAALSDLAVVVSVIAFFAFFALAALGFALDPTMEFGPGDVSALIFTAIYCSVLSILFITSASVLFNPAARSFRKKVAG